MTRPNRTVAPVDLEELFSQVPSFFAVLRGPTHVFERANEAYLQLIGHRNIIGDRVVDAFPEIRDQGFLELLDKVYKTGERIVAQAMPVSLKRTLSAEAKHIYVDFVYQPLRYSDGEVTGILVYGSDVTTQVVARKEAEEAEARARVGEEQFRTALNRIPALAWIADSEGWIFWYNRRWYEYTGTTESDMEGWGWQSVHDPKILPEVLERWTASIKSGEEFEMEFPLRGAAGEMRWFLTRVSPLRDEQGNTQRWFGTNTDVHLQREAAEAARAANQAKSDFLASMSHETRQPINATLGFLDVLEMGLYGKLNEQQMTALERVRSNQRQLLTLITDILSFAKLEAGKVKLDLETIECKELMDSILALVEPQVNARGLTLEIEEYGDQINLIGDRNRILQVCTNLITNSTRATESGGRITVRFVARSGVVDIEIEDNGKGIPAEKLETIFAPFVQLERTLANPAEGVGLGLAISRDLAIAMGGTLSVESTVGVGSVFTLTLKRAG